MSKRQMNFEELLTANPDHRYGKHKSRHSMWITCAAGCLWQREYSRHMNALVRASKIRSAFIKHLREIEAAKPSKAGETAADKPEGQEIAGNEVTDGN